jgi:hypothetical protein
VTARLLEPSSPADGRSAIKGREGRWCEPGSWRPKSQRAIGAAESWPLRGGKPTRGSHKQEGLQDRLTFAELARQWEVGEALLKRATALVEDDPDAAASVKTGTSLILVSLARGVEFEALMAVVRCLGELTDTADVAVSMDAAQSQRVKSGTKLPPTPQDKVTTHVAMMVRGRDPQSGVVYTSAISPKQWAMAMDLQRRMAKRPRPVAAPIVSPPARAREVAPRRQVATVSRSDGGALGGDSGDPSRPSGSDLARNGQRVWVSKGGLESTFRRGGVH